MIATKDFSGYLFFDDFFDFVFGVTGNLLDSILVIGTGVLLWNDFIVSFKHSLSIGILLPPFKIIFSNWFSKYFLSAFLYICKTSKPSSFCLSSLWTMSFFWFSRSWFNYIGSAFMPATFLINYLISSFVSRFCFYGRCPHSAIRISKNSLSSDSTEIESAFEIFVDFESPISSLM